MQNRLEHTNFELDETTHIEINQDAIRASKIGDALIRICPANVYSYAPNGDLISEYAGCLECGTCRQIAPEGALIWHYPNGGFGVDYQQG